MSNHHVIPLFILFALISCTFSSDLINLEALETCYENLASFSDHQLSLEAIERIKVSIIQNTEAKQVLLDNSFELSKAKMKLLKCTEELMKRNQFRALERFVEEVLDPLDIDFSPEMRLFGNQIKKDIDSVITLAHAKRNTQIVTPVFQWIQSQSNIFLQIKFAHRHDAPGCLEVKNEKIEFTENGFYFTAFGMQGQQPLQFVLNLTLHKSIVLEQSTWNMESVGRLFVNITKAEPEVWVFLLKDNGKSPGMRLWWEMKENYKDVMKEYEKLVEQYEEEESENKRNKGKKKRQEEAAINPADDEL